ncbi:MAG: PASTA domain-containing protein [Bacteroidetes bacterium]|nr:PASTA domain-containing protein [Bacteroidota bacterium]
MAKTTFFKSFWLNLLAAVILIALVIFLFLQLLGSITKHGQYLTVPGVLNKNTADAVKFLEDKGFEVVIQDSVFIDSLARGVVLKQLPDPNSTVKINRTVYLTVNRVTPPLVDMPALEGKSISYALELLKRSHLLLGDTTYRSDFMKNSVLEQSYAGNAINSGSKIPWGSKIDLVIGSGLDKTIIPVPSLMGLTFSEAKIVLETNNIMLGAVIVEPDVLDTAAAFIYKQSPPKLNEQNEPNYIQPGQIMDVWLSLTQKNPVDTLK